MFNVHFNCITISGYEQNEVLLMNGKLQNECRPNRIHIKNLFNFSILIYENSCDFFFLSFRKYPAHLAVTVGSYQPETTGSVSLTRPMSVLEEETTGDIYTCASDGDDPIDEQSHQVTSHSATENPLRNSMNERVEPKTLKIKPRLPGQV